MSIVTIWRIARDAITGGLLLSLVSATAAFAFAGWHLDFGRNAAIAIGIVGLALSLVGDIGTRTLRGRVDAVMLYGQPLQIAKVSLIVTFDSAAEDQKVNHPTNYVAFLNGAEVMLLASHPMTRHGESDGGNITFQADLDMDESSTARGRPLYVLKDVDRVQIAINQMPKDGIVVDGKMTCILNNAVLAEIRIPPQQVAPSGFIIFDIPSEAFADFAE